MIKKVIILVAVDILLLVAYIFLVEKPDPSVAIGELIFIPFLFIVNLVAALLLLAFRKKETCFALLINAALAPVFFHIIWGAWYDHDRENHYKTLHFRASGTRYELTIYKQTNDYNIRNSSVRNGTEDDLNGHYTEKKGTYFLTDSGRTIIVTEDMVIGFPKPLDTLLIEKDSYYW